MALMHRGMVIPTWRDPIGRDGRISQAFPNCPLEATLFGMRPPGLRRRQDGSVELDVFCFPMRHDLSHNHITCLFLMPYGQDTELYVRV
jgi:hypothetical protein